MVKNIFLLGSTGSIGDSTLKILKKNKKKFNIKLLSTNENVEKIFNQAIEFNVKQVVIFNKQKYLKYNQRFKKKRIKVFFNIKDALRNKKRKVFLTINAISGIDGLEPTLDVIKFSNNIAIANKESIICGWKFIKKELTKNKTDFIPLDSEHFSIWSLLRNENYKNIKKIYLTASGGPFLNKKLNEIKNIKSKYALRHPNWKMGKKISIDSATMMNKIFEIIEAVNIFNLNINKFEILIHPKSYIHAIVHFKSGLIKLLAHDTTMEIPIANALYKNQFNYLFEQTNFKFELLNGENFIKPNKNNFPLLNILNYKFNKTYFEIILVSLNDELVKKYLENKISYISIHNIMLILLKKPYFKKYYKSSPSNINDIKIMVEKSKKFLNEYLTKNAKNINRI